MNGFSLHIEPPRIFVEGYLMTIFAKREEDLTVSVQSIKLSGCRGEDVKGFLLRYVGKNSHAPGRPGFLTYHLFSFFRRGSPSDHFCQSYFNF